MDACPGMDAWMDGLMEESNPTTTCKSHLSYSVVTQHEPAACGHNLRRFSVYSVHRDTIIIAQLCYGFPVDLTNSLTS